MSKAPDIGLKQAALLCQMTFDQRLTFLSEGLPIVLASAEGFWDASRRLLSMPREAEVLCNHAEEEAAKILIIMDMVRCPKKLVASRMGKMIVWFYDHLARVIYANAASWRPMNVAQLRQYVDDSRQSHYLEGNLGEYIVPNFELTNRESMLYADIAAFEDRLPLWSAPKRMPDSFPDFVPPVLALGKSLAALGIFRVEGLRAAAEVWNTREFKDAEGYSETKTLTQRLLQRVVEEKLPTPAAEQNDVSRIYDWQMPMYNLDLRPIPVPIEQLQRERDAILYAEMGYNDEYY
jgi:hypothetical protein